jgi:hypothetical protein
MMVRHPRGANRLLERTFGSTVVDGLKEKG